MSIDSRLRRAFSATLSLALAVGIVAPVGAVAAPNANSAKNIKAKNVIVMISDGMGYSQLEAANLFETGKPVAQSYERFPVRLGMSTFAHPSVGGMYDSALAWGSFDWVKKNPTDSAAAATAMSTGIKTYNAGIGVDVDANNTKHTMEYAEDLGKATGVVSSVQISHATPAGFVAHNASRNDYQGIAAEMFNESAADVIMGAGHPAYTDDNVARTPSSSSYRYVGGKATWDALVAGTAGADADGDGIADPFTFIESRADFQALANGAEAPDRVAGIARVATTLQQARSGDRAAGAYEVPMNEDVPTLEEMTKAALNVLDNNENGLFLMVEGGAVDWSGHANEMGRIIEEQADFNASVDAVIDWVDANSNWGETLLIVTGDHETGYLTGPGSGQTADGPVWNALTNNGAGFMPGMQFNSGDHTNGLIPLFVKGSAARAFTAAAVDVDPVRGAYVDNTDIAKIAIAALR